MADDEDDNECDYVCLGAYTVYVVRNSALNSLDKASKCECSLFVYVLYGFLLCEDSYYLLSLEYFVYVIKRICLVVRLAYVTFNAHFFLWRYRHMLPALFWRPTQAKLGCQV